MGQGGQAERIEVSPVEVVQVEDIRISDVRIERQAVAALKLVIELAGAQADGMQVAVLFDGKIESMEAIRDPFPHEHRSLTTEVAMGQGKTGGDFGGATGDVVGVDVYDGKRFVA